MATFELTKDYLATIEEAISSNQSDFLKSQLDELFPADIANILFELSGEGAHALFQLLDTEIGAEVLSNIETDDRKKERMIETVMGIKEMLDALMAIL